MDSLTHIVVGAAIGEIVLGKHLGKKAMIWGALADTIPDFDVVMNYLTDPVSALMAHRGITHSFLFAFIMPFPLAWLFQKIYSGKGELFKNWWLLFFLGFITHVLLDCMTTYGTGLFEPFSNARIEFDNMFVLDPLFTLPLLVSIIALLVMKRESPKRKTWNIVGLSLFSCYIIMSIFIKLHVNSIVEKSLEGTNTKRFFTTPTSLNNFLWMTIAEKEDHFLHGYYSVFDKEKTIVFDTIPKNENLIDNLTTNESLKTLKHFSKGYYCFTKNDSAIFFNDLRFGRISPFAETKGPFVFQFQLNIGADNSMILEKGRWNSSTSLSDEFNNLITRIKGK